MEMVEKVAEENNAVKRFIFRIKPMTWVRVTQNDRIWFRIPEDKITSPTGLSRKKRIQTYYQYKDNLSAIAKQQRFVFQMSGMAVYFFLPMAVRWSKKKKRIFHLQGHTQKPDLSNLLKAFEDSLLKKDETISGYSGLGKFWVDAEEGWIEVLTGLPEHKPNFE